MEVPVPLEYETPEGMRTLANYLRGSHGIKVRSGIEHEKRVEFFKGKRLVEKVLEAKKWPKSLPKITDKAVAMGVASLLVKNNFFHRSEKVDTKKGYLKISQKNVFEENGYYTWMYAGSLVWSNIATFLIIAIVIGFTLLPVWPDAAKKVLWYLTCSFLIFMLVFIFLRFIAFLIMWLLGFEFWVFPRLFDESLSFIDSFKPVYTFEKGSAGQGYYRMALVVGMLAFGYWAWTQPTEFDEFVKAQQEFLDDIYSGNLLADVAAVHSNAADRSKSKIPDLETLLRDMAADEIEMTKEHLETDSQSADFTLGEEEEEEAKSRAAHNAAEDDMLETLLNSDE